MTQLARRWLYLPLFLALITAASLLPAVPAGAQSGLGGLFGGDDDILPVASAFPFALNTSTDEELAIEIDIRRGYYLYRDALAIRIGETHIEPADIAFPGAEIKEDEFFGRQPVYTRPVSLLIDTAAAIEPGTPVSIDFQGCAEAGVCYPPYTVRFAAMDASGEYSINPTATLLTPAGAGSDNATGNAAAPASSAGGGEAGRLERLLSEASLPVMLAGFFAAGLLLAFTACLYPMIPILSGLIAGDPHRSGSLRAFGLSLVYIESTAITYALAGVAAGMTGAAIQADLQSPWVLGSFAAVFVVLALGMFGVFELRMPAALQTRLTLLANRQRGGTVIGVALMGVLSTLIVGACSGPALIAALVFIGSTGDAWLGGLALFTLANGMGLPLLVIGTAAGRWLPKSGPWMNTVRAIFGVGFLAVALWMLERFIAGPLTLGLWALLFIGVGVWLGAFERAQAPVSQSKRLARTLGIALVIWGGACLLGAAGGGRDVLQPLSGLSLTGAQTQQEKLPFRDIDNLAQMEAAMADAAAADRPVMVEVYADWCVYCVQLERRTLTDPRVHEAVAHALLLRADVTAMNDNHRELMQALEVYLPPAIIFYDANGIENRDARVVGFLDPDAFIARASAGLGAPD